MDIPHYHHFFIYGHSSVGLFGTISDGSILSSFFSHCLLFRVERTIIFANKILSRR